MLNKIFLLLLTLAFSTNSFAEDKSFFIKDQPVKLTPKFIRIREPFTALAIAHLTIENKSDKELKIKKLYSDQARHVGLYEKYTSDIGAEQIKRAKNVYISPNQTTEFGNTKYQIIFTGLNKKYEVGEEVKLNIEIEDIGSFITYIPVHASYK
mgnify:CR=1 FL=1